MRTCFILSMLFTGTIIRLVRGLTSGFKFDILMCIYDSLQQSPVVLDIQISPASNYHRQFSSLQYLKE